MTVTGLHPVKCVLPIQCCSTQCKMHSAEYGRACIFYSSILTIPWQAETYCCSAERDREIPTVKYQSAESFLQRLSQITFFFFLWSNQGMKLIPMSRNPVYREKCLRSFPLFQLLPNPWCCLIPYNAIMSKELYSPGSVHLPMYSITFRATCMALI